MVTGWRRQAATTVTLWDVQSGKPTSLQRKDAGAVLAVAFGPGGDWLASGGVDGKLRLWRVDTGQPLWECDTLAGELSKRRGGDWVWRVGVPASSRASHLARTGNASPRGAPTGGPTESGQESSALGHRQRTTCRGTDAPSRRRRHLRSVQPAA